MESVKETRGRKPIHELGVRWCDDKTEYIKMYMRIRKDERVICECFIQVQKYKLANHQMTQKHQKRILDLC